jgi:hypothetical protein
MARPIGQFKASALKLFDIIYGISQETGTCKSSNAYLASRLEMTERQIARYVKYLKENNLIAVTTQGPFKHPEGGLYRIRHIRCTPEIPKEYQRTPAPPKVEEPPIPPPETEFGKDVAIAYARMMAEAEARKRQEEEWKELGIGQPEFDMAEAMAELDRDPAKLALAAELAAEAATKEEVNGNP